MDQAAASTSSSAQTQANASVIELRSSKNGRVSGKTWKSEKAPTHRSYISAALKTPFEKRMEKEKVRKAVKAVEKDMKDEATQAAERKHNNIRERRERQEEKKRMEEMAAKMSAKKLQRLKKRQGRSKKING